MKYKNSSFNLIKYLENLVKSKKSEESYNRVENHIPSWMYRNE